eukprot:2101543-Prymnesium_polylepis.1
MARMPSLIWHAMPSLIWHVPSLIWQAAQGAREAVRDVQNRHAIARAADRQAAAVARGAAGAAARPLPTLPLSLSSPLVQTPPVCKVAGCGTPSNC